MGLVFVVRHGETDWNRAGRYQGQRESELTELGKSQARALADDLGGAKLARVVSSPLARCVQTAAPLAARAGVQLETDERLIEIAHGTWEGRLRADIERDEAPLMRAWREEPHTVRFAGGESLDDVVRRWTAFAASIGDRGDVAVVTHDVVVRIAILQALGMPYSQLWKPRVSNGAYATFVVELGRWALATECSDAHLAGLLADTSGQAL